MPKHFILVAGKTKPVQARRFAAYIGAYRSWFLVHASTDVTGHLVVSHSVSGMKVCDVGHLNRQAALGDDVGAAKLALMALVAKHGADRVNVVLNSAPPLSKA